MGCHNMSWSGSVLLLGSLDYILGFLVFLMMLLALSPILYHSINGVRCHHGMCRMFGLGLGLSM